MGNTPSQESQRGASRKLSKPRVGNRDRASASAAASQSAVHHIKAAQFSNSYLVGAVPVSVPVSRRTSFDAVSPGPGAAMFHDSPFAAPTVDEPRTSPTAEPKSPIEAAPSELSRAERIERRSSAGQASLRGSAPPSRAPSRQGRESAPPLTRARSAHSAGKRATSSYGASITEEPLPRSNSRSENRNSLVRRSNSHAGESQDPVCNLRRNSTTPQPEAMPPNRTQSETSLYPPHRRRSLVLTPGVATRAESQKTLKKKSSFRKSMLPTPTISRENSIDSKTARHMSLPVLPADFELTERASTPSEADYKQLGVMKFGTLKITNGSPQPSPAREPKGGILYAPQPTSAPAGLLSNALDSSPTPNHDFKRLTTTQSRTGSRPELRIQPASPRTLSDPAPQSFRKHAGNLPLSPSSPRNLVTYSSTTDVAPVTVRPPTPELEITSRHAAVDDNLFEDDDSPRLESTEPVAHMAEVATELDVGLKSPTRPSLVNVTRKDSGYVSNTSKSSRKALSTADSRGNSNVSSGSARGDKQKRRTFDNSEYLATEDRSPDSNGSNSPTEFSSNGSSSLRTEEIQTPPEDHLQPSISSKDDGSASTPRTSTSSNTSRSIIRLPSFRAGKNRDSKQLKKSPSSERPQSSGNLLQRVSSPTKSRAGTNGAFNQTRMSGLRRLLSGSSKKNLSTSYAVHEFSGSVPSVPTAVEKKLQEHNGRFPTAPKRLALRVEASQDSLGTIMSVEDPVEYVMPEPRPAPEPQQSAEPWVPKPQRPNRLSISSVSGSITGAATSLLLPKSSSQRNIIRRRSTIDEKTQHSMRGLGMDSDSDDDVLVDVTMVDDRNFMIPSARRSIGNSAFDQALTAIGDQGRYPIPEDQSWMNKPYVDPRAPRRQQQLRSRKSAPDVRQTAAGHLSPVFERETQKVSKTPPPISMQTRGSKKKRNGPKPSRRQSSPAGVSYNRLPAPYDPYESGSSNASSFEDLNHFPSAASAAGPYPRAAPMLQLGLYPDQRSVQQPNMKRPTFGQRYSYDRYSQRQQQAPPQHQQQQSNLAPMPSREQSKDYWMPNRHRKEGGSNDEHAGQGQHSRPGTGNASGDGPNAPFRVLHSYNSPAYKGTPIWG